MDMVQAERASVASLVELQNRVMQNDVTLRVTNSEVFRETLLSS